MAKPEIESDAKRAFDVLRRGGTAILPMDVGYSLIGGSERSLRLIFETKGRAPDKLNAMLGDMVLHREIHRLDTRGQEIIDAITEDYGLPLGAIAPGNMDHPIFQRMTPRALSGSTRDGTVLMLLNAGRFHAEICRLSREHGHPLFGSSANRTLQGTKFRVEDIENDISEIADITIDHGLRKYHLYQSSSTLLDLKTLRVVRFGACYELIADILDRHFGVVLPPPESQHLRNLGGATLRPVSNNGNGS